MKSISLKYRIALTIFVLEAIMVALVLWQTQKVSLDASRRQLEANEEVMLNMLSDLSRFALITSEYGELQPYVEKMDRDPHVVDIVVADHRNRIVVSTDPFLLGSRMPSFKDTSERFWRTMELTNAAGYQGLLAIQFSNAALLKAYQVSRKLGVIIALVSMAVIALVGIFIGYMLTRRLDKLNEASKRLAQGDLDANVDIRGSDEVAGLSRTFNMMVDKIKSNIGELMESEEKFRQLTENIHEVFWIGSPDWNEIYYISPAYEEIWGRSRESLYENPLSWLECVEEEDRNRIMEFIDEIRKNNFGGLTEIEFPEYRLVLDDGLIRWVQAQAFPVRDEQGKVYRIAGIAEDITERKKLETQLLHAQKMEAVGQLAGGVAHDFNNILTAIIGYGNMLRMKMNKDTPLRPYVDNILSSSERASGLTRSLLAFSRKQIIQPKPIDLNETVRSVGKLLVHLIGEDIELRTELTDNELTVLAERNQIEQVLMNLAANARDVMPNGGVLTIKTGAADLGEEYIKAHGFGEPGRYAVVSVTDTGMGMDKKTQGRIFEPFFTTKEIGRGTGLGLATVYGIIKQHNGYIDVKSALGKGATFEIYLPIIESEMEETKIEEPVGPKGGTETILLAEDEGKIRALTRTVLEEFDYTVIEAVDGEDAINKFMGNKEKIQLLLIDVVMPKKNGREVYEHIKKIRPGIKAIFISGYTADIIRAKGILEEEFAFISKPLSPQELLRKVRDVLDA